METKLLAFKPFLYAHEQGKLYPLLLPNWEWPKLKVVTSPCPLHKEPVEGCTCGVYSTVDLDEVRSFVSRDVNTDEEPVIPLMGVIQVLGRTVVEGYTLRSWGAFLWGLIQPATAWETDFWPNLFYRTSAGVTFYRNFRPVLYNDVESTFMDVVPGLKTYNLVKGY